MKALPLLFVLLSVSRAQLYTISTIAGNGRATFAGERGPALNARLVQPSFVALDSAGNTFVSDAYYASVFRISAGGTIVTFAGTGTAGFSGDNGPAAAAQLNTPQGLAVDPAGNLYIADNGNGRIRKVTPDGTISTAAMLQGSSANSVAVDPAGNLYVSGGNTIRLIRPTGGVTVIAGTGVAGFSGDNGPATSAQFNTPWGLKVDGSGNIFVADLLNNRIRKINAQGVITTVAGTGMTGFGGDNQLATAARIAAPQDIAVDAKGNLYIADSSNFRIRMVNPAGVISTIAGAVNGSPSQGTSFNDGLAEQARLIVPVGIAIDGAGNLTIGVIMGRQVRRITQGNIATIAGALPTGAAADNIPGTSATLLGPWGIAVDAAGSVYVADDVDQRIRKISRTGVITTFAGNGLYGNVPDSAAATEVATPRGISLDPAGNLFFTSGLGFITRRIALDGTVTTLAGTTPGFAGDGSAALGAQFNMNYDVLADPAGNLYISDSGNNRIRKIDATGKVDTVAGTGEPGYGGDGGPAKAAKLFSPRQLALDGAGNLYIADASNNRIRKLATDGTISTIAGTGVSGPGGDGGPATSAQLAAANGVAVDSAGNVFIALAARIRKVDASTGVISTVAGTALQGFSGDGGLASNAMLSGAQNIALDGAGNIYVAERTNFRVRKLTPWQISAESVLNAASQKSGAVAPGEVVVIKGAALGPATAAGSQVNDAGVLTNILASTQVFFDGIAAPLVSVQASQITAIVPYAVAGQATTQLELVVNGNRMSAVTIPVTDVAPGIFTQNSTGTGPATVLNADSTPNTAQNPAAKGSTVTILGTGEGQTNPAGVDGLVASSSPPTPSAAVTAQIGGVDAEVVSSGGAPGQPAGYFQVTVRIPAEAPAGDAAPVSLTVGGVSSQGGVTISIQ